MKTKYQHRETPSRTIQPKREKLGGMSIVDNCNVAQAKFINLIQGVELSAQGNETVQKKRNNTGLPDNLKTGVENMSGLSMDDVRVHYNSSSPAQMQAHAYTQGSNIHVAPGQEKHLAHEAWHVVQQKQGRVLPTMQMQGVSVNNDASLESEADAMGSKVL